MGFEQRVDIFELEHCPARAPRRRCVQTVLTQGEAFRSCASRIISSVVISTITSSLMTLAVRAARASVEVMPLLLHTAVRVKASASASPSSSASTADLALLREPFGRRDALPLTPGPKRRLAAFGCFFSHRDFSPPKSLANVRRIIVRPSLNRARSASMVSTRSPAMSNMRTNCPARALRPRSSESFASTGSSPLDIVTTRHARGSRKPPSRPARFLPAPFASE